MATVVSSGEVNGISRNTIQALADTIGMPIRVQKNRELWGSDKFQFSSSALGLKGRMEAEIVSGFATVNGEDAAVLVHLSHNLYVFVFASDFDKKIWLLVLDKAKFKNSFKGLLEETQVRSWRGALRLLQPTVVRTYTRDFNEGHWTKSSYEKK